MLMSLSSELALGSASYVAIDGIPIHPYTETGDLPGSKHFFDGDDQTLAFYVTQTFILVDTEEFRQSASTAAWKGMRRYRERRRAPLVRIWLVLRSFGMCSEPIILG